MDEEKTCILCQRAGLDIFEEEDSDDPDAKDGFERLLTAEGNERGWVHPECYFFSDAIVDQLFNEYQAPRQLVKSNPELIGQAVDAALGHECKYCEKKGAACPHSPGCSPGVTGLHSATRGPTLRQPSLRRLDHART